MEVVTATPNGNSPFHNHDVREWSRLDRLTGVLERARLESDHWTASTNNATHKYGKVVDSRARTTSDGNQLAQAQRQLEVFQSHHQSGGSTSSGGSTTCTSSRLQVIKTQTAVVSSNSSRWSQQPQNIARSSSKTTVQQSSSISSSTVSKDNDSRNGAVVDGKKDTVLQGFDSLQLALNPLDLSSQKSKASVGRSVGRRPPSRSRLKEDTSAASTTITTAASSSHQHQTSSAAATAFRIQTTTAATNLHRVSRLCHQIHDTAVKSTFAKTAALLLHEPREDGDGSVEITEIESGSETNKSSLSRTKSTSSEDLHEKANRSTEDLEDLEQLQNWRRTSKLRRSLQYPNRQQKSGNHRPLDLPENKGNVRKIREDLETGRRLSTALRGNNVDLDALDQILQSISSSSSVQSDVPERDTDLIVAKKTKKSSFVTVESIKDMRSRLRRTSSPILPDREDADDGIVTEELPKPSDLITAMEGSQSRVRSYVYGMETMLGKGTNVSGTGSLESRTKQLNGNSALRNEDWYSRRKSYGFEQVHDNAEDENSIALKTKNRVESSTDSGICRSTEIVVVPAATKVSCDSNSSDNELDLAFNKNRKYSSYTKLDKKDTMLEIDENPFSSRKATEELANIWNKRASSLGRDTYSSNSPTSDCSLFPTKLRSDTSSWINSDSERDSSKSTTVINDDFKYSFNNTKHSDFTDDDTLANKRNNKKVEFCKTEVHFVADSGRVNIVETDEKPPPTQNFRRRRRNTGNFNLEELKKTGVPVLRFGDTTYEKTLFGDLEDTQTENNSADEGVYESVQLYNDPPVSSGVVTVNINTPHYDYEEDQKENYENGTPRGILKNKPVKPKPYILGDSSLTLSETPAKSWTENPIWRSTVTVRNTFYDKNATSSDNNDVSSDNERSDYGKLLRQQLRPSNGIGEMKRNSENFDLLRGRHSPVDLRRSSWSVADRVKKVEDLQWTENKGYSTKINIGNGEATVVENRHPTWPRRDEVSGQNYSKLTPERDVASEPETKSKLRAEKSYSPQIIRRPSPIVANQSRPLKSSEYLSSPVLVQPSQIKNVPHEATDNKITAKTTTVKKTATKSVEVLRQPKKSQMAYFGVDVSPTTLRKNKANAAISPPTKLSEKPDLLQFSSKVDNYASKSYKRNVPAKPSNGHIYENLTSADRNKKFHPVKREFDSKILEELTKAADEILQAVNGYTDEERHNRFSTEDEDARKFNPETLETISEIKSVHNKTQQHHLKSTTSSRLKQASSTSSIDSISRECLNSIHIPRSKPSSITSTSKSIDYKYRSKKSPSSVTSDVANKSQTKARRLQRASSREALLQSHGSSSEDLAINVEMPTRKPRLVKRTKTTQLIMSNGLEIKKLSPVEKKQEPIRRKPEERVPMGVPEIRHKTAVSTIRSTAEKVAANKERAKQRNEDVKKKPSNTRRDHNKGITSSRTTVTSTNAADPRGVRSSAGREYNNHSSAPYRSVTSANIPFVKKPHKSDGLTK